MCRKKIIRKNNCEFEIKKVYEENEKMNLA